jgi:hypothetical protein
MNNALKKPSKMVIIVKNAILVAIIALKIQQIVFLALLYNKFYTKIR